MEDLEYKSGTQQALSAALDRKLTREVDHGSFNNAAQLLTWVRSFRRNRDLALSAHEVIN